MTVAVIGAGIAGAACARALAGSGIDVEVLDRGRVAGGRLATRSLGGRRVDTGASYLTARDARFTAVVDDWLHRGLVHPWTDTFAVAGPEGLTGSKSGPLRYGTGTGLRSLVEDLLTGLSVRQEHEVAVVGPGPTVDGRAYEAVVLAMPDPQAARLLDASLQQEHACVAGRRWEPVLALVAAWPGRTWPEDFSGCFVDGSEQLGWIADDGRRRGDAAPVLVAHSTSSFAGRHLADADAAGPVLVDAVRRLLDLREEPSWTFVQRWSLARPAQGRDEPFHLATSGVGLCGDGWGSPRVETAYLSGRALGERLAQRLTG